MKNPSIMSIFADNVRNQLTESAWSIQDLADACGIARPNLSKILHGKENVTLDRAQRIATALGVTLSELVEEPVSLSA